MLRNDSLNCPIAQPHKLVFCDILLCTDMDDFRDSGQESHEYVIEQGRHDFDALAYL